MREILFKAKRLDNGEEVQGYYWTNELGNHFIRVVKDKDGNFINAIDFEIDPETLCELIGLTDNNGKMIWENDIIKCAIEDPCTGKIDRFYNCYVKYCKTTDAMGWYGIDERKVLNKIPPQQDYVEIIGNIHDNKDLIGE